MKLFATLALLGVLLVPAPPARADERPLVTAAPIVRPAPGAIVLGEDGGPRLIRQLLPGVTLDQQESFAPFGQNYPGGIALAAGDLNNDGRTDLAVAQTGVVSPGVQIMSQNGGVWKTTNFLLPYIEQSNIIAILIGLAHVTGGPQLELITVPGEGVGPVKVINPLTGAELLAFNPYPGQTVNGLRVATGDLNGDGRAEIIVAPGPGTAAPVRIFGIPEGTATAVLIGLLLPFSASYQGGISVAAGDLNGDGKDDVIVGAETGAPFVRAYSEGDPNRPLVAFNAVQRIETVGAAMNVTVGAFVSAADLNGDGRAEMIIGTTYGGPWFAAYSYNGGPAPTEIVSLSFPTPPSVRNPAVSANSHWRDRPAAIAGDFNNDGTIEIDVFLADAFTPQAPAIISSYSISSGAQTITPYGPSFTGGVRVATGDVNGDGRPEIITGPGPGGGPHVKIFDGRTLNEIGSFLAFEPSFQGGIFVAAGDLDGDGRAEIVVGRGPGGPPEISVWGNFPPNPSDWVRRQPNIQLDSPVPGGVRVAVPDVYGDGRSDIAHSTQMGGGSGVGIVGQCRVGTGGPTVYVAGGDLNGDGRDEVIASNGEGGLSSVKILNRNCSVTDLVIDPFNPGFRGGLRVAAGDLFGDGREEILIAPGPGITPTVSAIGFNFDKVSLSQFANLEIPFRNGAFVAGLYRDRPNPVFFQSRLMDEGGTSFSLRTQLLEASGVISLTSPIDLGTVSVALSSTLPLNPPLGVRFLPLDYTIDVSTQPTAPVSLCLPYPVDLVAEGGPPPANLRLYHRTATGWEDITTLVDYIDSDDFNVASHWVGRQICGRTGSFSPFAIGGSSQVFLPIILKTANR